MNSREELKLQSEVISFWRSECEGDCDKLCCLSEEFKLLSCIGLRLGLLVFVSAFGKIRTMPESSSG